MKKITLIAVVLCSLVMMAGPAFAFPSVDDHVILDLFQPTQDHIAGRYGFSGFAGERHLERWLRRL